MLDGNINCTMCKIETYNNLNNVRTVSVIANRVTFVNHFNKNHHTTNTIGYDTLYHDIVTILVILTIVNESNMK